MASTGTSDSGAMAGGGPNLPSSESSDSSEQRQTPTKAEEGGGGNPGLETDSGAKGEGAETSDRDGAMVADIPEDIPVDGMGDDTVAAQIREAAMAETDPDIREALWDEYRRHTGIKN